MDSVPRKAAKIEAFDLEKDLLATDPRFNYLSKVINTDGSIFEIANSFIVKSEKYNYIYVFAEHYDTMVFDLDEVEFFGYYEQLNFPDFSMRKDD